MGVEAHPDQGTVAPHMQAGGNGARPCRPIRLGELHAMPLTPQISLILRMFLRRFPRWDQGVEQLR